MEKVIATTARMRQINRELVLDALKGAADGLKIADLTKLTNLSLATCSNIVKSLVETGEAVEKDTKESDGGRPARVFLYNARQTTIACLLLRGQADRAEILYTINDAGGAVIADGRRDVRNPVLADVDRLLADLKKDFAVTLVVIALSGVVTDGVVAECPVPALVGVDLGAHIREKHDLTVLADNDTNFAAAAYTRANTDATAGGLAFLVFPADRCIGCSLILGNHLVRGKSDFAGELSAIVPLLKAAGARSPGARTAELAGSLAAIVIALVNPDAVVVAGDGVRPDMRERILDVCLAAIPERHMPRIIVQTDYEKECFAGMRAMAANHFSYPYKLLETGKMWCG